MLLGCGTILLFDLVNWVSDLHFIERQKRCSVTLVGMAMAPGFPSLLGEIYSVTPSHHVRWAIPGCDSQTLSEDSGDVGTPASVPEGSPEILCISHRYLHIANTGHPSVPETRKMSSKTISVDPASSRSFASVLPG
jgi:hypothetical protein